MRRLFAFIALFVGLHVPLAHAAMQRDPTGVNVSTSSPTTLVIRFADSAGAGFTTTDAFFCSVDPSGGAGLANANTTSCEGAGGVVLGRLPLALDRGSSSSAKTSINDIMTIPMSVARRSVVQAREGQHSDFFYIRKFTPVGAANLGAGAGVPVLVVITCRLSGGTSRTPLSLTRVVLYGAESEQDDPVLLVRVTPENMRDGRIKADIDLTGTGVLSGWWEVRTPADPEIRTIDRYTEASLTETERNEQRRFQRVKRFRVNAPLSGRLTLQGPRYSELPQSSPGLYEIFLRVEATRDREAMSRLASAGGSTNLFSGAAAGFPLPILEYRIGVGEDSVAALSALAPRLVFDKRDDGLPQVGVRWTVANVGSSVVRIEAMDHQTGKSFKILAPLSQGYVVIPSEWTRDIDIEKLQYSVTALGPNNEPADQPLIIRR